MRKSYGAIQFAINWLKIKRILPRFFPEWAKLPPTEEESTRVLLPDGTVRWVAAGAVLPFADHVEVSGFSASHILSYRVKEDRSFDVFIHSAYPDLRMKPNVTEATYSHNFLLSGTLFLEGEKAEEEVRFIDLKGNLTIRTTAKDAEVTHTYFPAVYTRALIEKVTVTNRSDHELCAALTTPVGAFVSLPSISQEGKQYLSLLDIADEDGKMMMGLTPYCRERLAPDTSATFYAVYYTRPEDEDILVDARFEERKRNEFIERCFSGLRVETPNPVLNAAFSHAVLRGSESIFDTREGLVHSPGGGSYYAAIWTNDTIEYAAPFFGYAGYDTGAKATVNAIRMFAEEIDHSGVPYARKKSIRSSIFGAGEGKWALVGDRGDVQMYGSGAARFALAMGDKRLAEEIFRHVEFCVEYTKSRTDQLGRVRSDADELEGRFPHGKYNLATNCLAYDLYLNAAYLAGELSRADLKYEYLNLAARQRSAIVKNFAGDVEGYRTYRYFKSNRVLRSWICLPMCFGIDDYAEDTADALFGERLYKNATLKTASNRNTVWDRSLLFALRGAFKAGFRARSLEALTEYSLSRLLGMHAPYPYEAYPEGNRRHLAAESLLYARIYTEGILGLQIVGFGKFTITPSLPKDWAFFRVRRLVIADMPVDIVIENGKVTVFDRVGAVVCEQPFINGQKITVDLN